MKNRMILFAAGMLMACLLPLAAYAQAQEWQSTSAMQGSGSAYSSQVTEVGATTIPQQATTTYSPANAPGRPRRTESSEWGNNQDGGKTDDPNAPLGDAVLPLLLMALTFAGYTALRRRKTA